MFIVSYESALYHSLMGEWEHKITSRYPRVCRNTAEAPLMQLF